MLLLFSAQSQLFYWAGFIFRRMWTVQRFLVFLSKEKKTKPVEIKEEKNTGKENIPAGIGDCCGLVACPPLVQQQQPPICQRIAIFPLLRENLPIFPICRRMTRCHISYHSLCHMMRGGAHLETSGCTGARNVRINLNCSFEWATCIIEKHYFGGIFLDTSSIFPLSIAEICSCCAFFSRSFCLPLLSVTLLEKF